MEHVYSNTACTLAASASESPDDSLFHDRNLDFIRPGRVQSLLFSDEPGLFYIYDKTYWNRQIFEGPLHNRAWAFQERFLSPRVLYFGRHQLLWECRSKHRCEVFPGGIPFHWPNKTNITLLKDRLDIGGTRNSLRISNLWNHLVKQFSQCSLTHPSDKLHAFAGIANVFKEIAGDEYAAGLWKSHFTLSLGWIVHNPKPRRNMGYRAPSWSWAFVDGPVIPRGILTEEEPLVELVKLDIETRTSDSMSAILGAAAVLKARVIPATFQLINMPYASLQTVYGRFKVPIFPDTMEVEITEGRKISYMPLTLGYVHFEGIGKTQCISCLILEEQGQSPKLLDRYRRVGYFGVHKGDGVDIDLFCMAAEAREIEII